MTTPMSLNAGIQDLCQLLRQRIAQDSRSYSQIARDSGVAQSTISRLISGQYSSLRPPSLDRLAEVYGLAISVRVDSAPMEDPPHQETFSLEPSIQQNLDTHNRDSHVLQPQGLVSASQEFSEPDRFHSTSHHVSTSYMHDISGIDPDEASDRPQPYLEAQTDHS